MYNALLDVFSKGTEGIPVAGDPKRSMVPIPSNEDWSMVGVVDSVALDSVVTWHKAFDPEATPLYAPMKYFGYPGIPPSYLVKVGQQQVFHRVGENDFVCFVPYCTLFIQDDGGEGYGRDVIFDDTGTVVVPAGSETLIMKAVEPLGQFHNSSPPFMDGRIYPGQKYHDANGVAKYYRVFLPGFGNNDFFFDVTIDGTTVRLTIDFSGKVKNFEVL